MTTEPSVAEDTWPCSVCGEPAGPDARSDCYRCGEYFHLRLTTTATGPDCGDVWLDDEVMALQFACRNCLAEHAGETAAPVQEPPPPEEPSEPARPDKRGTRGTRGTRRARRAESGASARDLARRRR